MKSYIMAKLHNLANIPVGAIWRGDGVFDYVEDDRRDRDIIKELLSEQDETGKVVFKKSRFTVKGRFDLGVKK